MSAVIDAAVAALKEKFGADGIEDGSVKFQIEGEGAVRVDASGVSADDSDADVTLMADADTFQEMMSGDLNPTSAFMTGKLKIDGDMGLAMKLATVLG
ncbi:putative sterol carrier protein [Rubricella aquisinus]|uniref:Putative sterol carrier protein n=1 Tax=Rubricella aquisinus TaxID=2028108 RepID=A0A840X0I9_9RHOB|nr:SCP2 sterol-binding domain-containing protein [Rubricella aquisinus]MBB5515405.1 putative sterol carrier protein [Rubricella aquisinus]